MPVTLVRISALESISVLIYYYAAPVIITLISLYLLFKFSINENKGLKAGFLIGLIYAILLELAVKYILYDNLHPYLITIILPITIFVVLGWVFGKINSKK